MIDYAYLSKGLNALARAHHLSTMTGHLGASVIAGYFVGEQRPDLDEEVYKGIEDDLARVMRGESVFGTKRYKNAKMTDPELFAPFPKEKPDESLIDGIAEALDQSLGKPRESGHNVIFASIAIRALKEHPELATPSVVEGIRKLMNKFRNSHPGSGYYGKGKGRIHGHKITLPEDDGIPPYEGMAGMALAVMNELINQSPEVHRQGYGSLVHVNNHAASIVDLANYGYAELVPKALKSHHHHLRLWKNLPNVVEELGPKKVSKHTPHDPAYWTEGEVPSDRALLTHRVKTMYGFDELKEIVEDEKMRTKAYDMLRHLM